MAVSRIASHNFHSGDSIVLDTNVLVLVHANDYGDPLDKRVAAYSGALEKALKKQAELVLLDVVLSEFIHAVEHAAIRDWIHRQQGTSGSFREDVKRFRQDPKLHDEAMEYVRISVEQIVSAYSFKSAPKLEPATAESFRQLMHSSKAGLNDVLIAEYCRARGADLLTNDGDMLAFEKAITIITI